MIKKILLLCVLFLGAFYASAQTIVKGAGIIYTNGAPTHTVNVNVDAETAIDTAAGIWYERSRDGLGWIPAGFRIQKFTGSSAPTAAPLDKESEVQLNDVDSLYRWRGGAWRHINKVLVYSAGTGISITGTTITNTGDLSATNEGSLTVLAGSGTTSVIQSNTSGSTNVTITAGTGLSISETGNTITLTNSAPDQTVTLTNGGGISISGTYPNFTLTASVTAAYSTIQEEGTSLTQRSILNFVGSAATAADNVTKTDVTFDSDVNALASTGTTGLYVITGTGTSATRTLTGPAEGITVTNGNGVSGNPTLALANDLAALEGLTGTGYAVRTAADTWAQRTFAAGTGISLTNADGVAGNTTITNSAPDQTVTLTNGGGISISGTYPNFTLTASVTAAYSTIQEEGTSLTQRSTFNFVGSALTAADDVPNTRTNITVDSDVNALASTGTTGLYVITGTGTSATRTLTGPAAGITVTNGNGVSGNPTLALANDLAALEGLAGTGYAVRTGTDTWAQRTFTAGTGISLTNADGVAGNTTITNSSPDQTVTLTNGGGISISGTYPNFTLTATDPSTTNEVLTVSDGTDSEALGGQTLTFVGAGGASADYDPVTNTLTITAAGGGGISNLNGLTAGTQSFATGTSGTDFNISSATATHTFNLPTASATNRGALSSADWTTFNNKDGSVTNEGSLTVLAGSGTTSVIQSNTSGSTDVTITAGTGLSISETGNTITLTNSAPDQTVSLTNGGGISITGTYPNFTLTASVTAAYSTIQEEGTSLTQRSILNFVGSAATAADNTTKTDVTFDSDVNALASTASTGIYVITGTGTSATRTLTGPAAGITVSNGNGVSGNPTLALANDLAALEGLAGTGYAVRTGTDTWAQRTFTAGTGISLTNADGVAGNTTITNSSPDQTVSLTNGGGISITGTYPNFTLTATDQSTTNEVLTVSDGTDSEALGGQTLTFVGAGGASADYDPVTNTLTITESGGSDGNGFYGGNSGNGGDATIPSVTKSTLSNQLTFYRATDDVGGLVPIRIEVPAGNEPDYLSMRTGSDSLLFSRGDQEFEMESNKTIVVRSNELLYLIADSLNIQNVPDAFDNEGTFLQISPLNTIVKSEKIDPDVIRQNGAATGDVLKWNGSKWAPAVDGGGSLTGTGADNQVAIWSSSTTVEGDADFIFDGDKLGIKQASPVYTVDVVGSIGIDQPSAFYLGTTKIAYGKPADNHFFFAGAGNATLSGVKNLGIGNTALSSVTTGQLNIGIGFQAGKLITTGQGNVAIGDAALAANQVGNNNFALGRQSLELATGSKNAAIGAYSMAKTTTGENNVSVGYYSLNANTAGTANAILGNSGMQNNLTGSSNTAMGESALFSTTAGIQNVSIGRESGYASTGDNNVFIGRQSAVGLGSGNRNIFIGQKSANGVTSGSDNIIIGDNLGVAGSLNNVAMIGNFLYATTQNSQVSSLVGIGTQSPSQRLHVGGNMRVSGAFYDSNNDPGTSGQVLSSTVTGTDWVDAGGGGSSFYQTLRDDGTDKTQRGKINFVTSANLNTTLTDDGANDETEVLISIKVNGVTDSEIAPDAVGPSEVIDASLTGDEFAQMSATTGQVLKWNGTTWAPANDNGGSDVATDLIWDAKGDLAVGTGANTAAKLTVGTDGKQIYADASTSTGLRWGANVISPAQITADQDNYNPTDWAKSQVVRISSNDIRAITSLASTFDGDIKTLINIGNYAIYFPADHPDGTAANRFTGTQDYYLFAGESVDIMYDNTSSRWRVLNSLGAANAKTNAFGRRLEYTYAAGSTTTGDHYFANLITSGGSHGSANAQAGLLGSHNLNTSTSASGATGVSFSKGSTLPMVVSRGHIWSECLISYSAVSNATETYTSNFSISSANSATLNVNNSVGIRYSHGINSGKFEGYSRDNGGTETTVDLTQAVSANTMYSLRIELDKANSEVRFYVNGVYSGRVSANMPTADTPVCPRLLIVKSAGTTSRTLRLHNFSGGQFFN